MTDNEPGNPNLGRSGNLIVRINVAVLENAEQREREYFHPLSFSAMSPRFREIYDPRNRHTTHAILPCNFQANSSIVGAHRTQAVFAVLRNLSLRQAREPGVR